MINQECDKTGLVEIVAREGLPVGLSVLMELVDSAPELALEGVWRHDVEAAAFVLLSREIEKQMA